MTGVATPDAGLAAESVLNSVDHAVLVVGDDNRIGFLNYSAELFFGGSRAVLIGRPLSSFIPDDSPLFLVLAQVRRSGASVSDPDVVFESPRIGEKRASLRASPMIGRPAGRQHRRDRKLIDADKTAQQSSKEGRDQLHFGFFLSTGRVRRGLESSRSSAVPRSPTRSAKQRVNVSRRAITT